MVANTEALVAMSRPLPVWLPREAAMGPLEAVMVQGVRPMEVQQEPRVARALSAEAEEEVMVWDEACTTRKKWWRGKSTWSQEGS